MLDWNDLQHLLAFSRHGSLAGAARELGVDPSTISRRLSALESTVGATLFLRTPTGMVLTAHGEDLAAAAARMEGALREALEPIRGEDARPVGLVRVSSTDGMAPILMGDLPDLLTRYPGLTIEVGTTGAAVDLLRGEADVAVRFFRATEAGLVARRVGLVGWALYGSEAYVSTRGAPEGDLSGHDVIGFDPVMQRAPGPRWLESQSVARVVLRCGSPRSAMTAVQSGMGVTVLPCFVATGQPGLVRLGPVVASSEVFVVMTEASRRLARVRVTVDFLADVFARHRALFAG